MDVTFTNVLEGARQYFQGLPSATAADSPFYHHQQQQSQQHPTIQQQQQQYPTSQHHASNQQQSASYQYATAQQYHTNQPYQSHQQYSNQQLLPRQQHASPYHSAHQSSSNSTGQPPTVQQRQQAASSYQAAQSSSNSTGQPPTVQQRQQAASSYQAAQSSSNSTGQPPTVQQRQQAASSYQAAQSSSNSTGQPPTVQQRQQAASSYQAVQSSTNSAVPPSSLHQQRQASSYQTAQSSNITSGQSTLQYQSATSSSNSPSSLQHRQQQASPYQGAQQQSSNSAGPPVSQSSWADQNRPPTRERTPVQRPSSHSSDGSRPPSQQSLQFQSQDVSKQYQNAYQKEPSHPSSQALQQSFNFSQPQSREAYRSHIASNSSYYPPASTQASRSSSKEQLVQPVQNYQYSQSSVYSKSQYGYPQNSYYSQAQAQQKKSSYKTPASESYPVSSQSSLNPYLEVTNNDRFSQMASSTQVSTQQYSHTHNLPPIAALSGYHSSKNNQSKEQTTHTSTAYHTKPTSSTSSMKPNENQRHETYTSSVATSVSYGQEQRSQNQPVHYTNYPYAPTVTTSTYSSVIMATPSNVMKSNQSYYHHGPNKAFIKNSGVNNQTSRLPVTKPTEFKNVTVIKENPLDLSVKTVKTTADSTLEEIEHSNKLQTNHMYPTFDIQKNLTQRTQPPALSAPKVDFQPKFNIPPTRHQIHPIENQNSHYQQAVYNNSYQHPKDNQVYSSYNASPPQSNPASSSNHIVQEQKNNMARQYQSPQASKKRPGEVSSSIVPEKMSKVEYWRHSIDLQIEKKLSSYKQQHDKDKTNSPTSSNRASTTNYPPINARDIYNFNQRATSAQQPAHNQNQNNHRQTYVPSPGTQQYPDYNHLSKHTNNMYVNPYATSVNPMLPPNMNKQQIPGGVDRKTLSLLRNSIEIKEQKKIEQMKSQENLPLHPRPEIQHSNTDVTAPLQPKLGVVGRNNVSPFTPTSFPETNMASMYKFHVPKIIAQSNNHQTQLKEIMKEESNTVIVNSTHSGSDYDGLAAFLAARIRTKGELKQVVPGSNSSNNNARVQMYVNEQIKSPPLPLSESPLAPNSSINSTNSSSGSVSPPKLVQEKPAPAPIAPRKRLFSKTEEEQSNNNLPPRDKSGIRSSSETSVFDFDDDDDNHMPVLERQSLEAMRRDRRTSFKVTNTNEVIKEDARNLETLPPPSRSPSPFDELFDNICDNFVDYLKNGPKKRGGRKKKVVPEVPTPIKTEKLEENIDSTQVEVKKELIEEQTNATGNIDKKEIAITPHKIGILSDSDFSDDERLAIRNTNKVRRKILSSSESSDEEQHDVNPEKKDPEEKLVVEKEEKEDTVKMIPEVVKIDLMKPTEIKQEKVDPVIETLTTDSKIEEPNKKLDPLTVIRPAKKPSFGTGSEFCHPGWEEEVYKYKKSLRMPRSLIQVTRPPNSRLSTSLPDLDPPCPPSPTPSMTSSVNVEVDASKDCNKKLIKKFKSEPIDSDSESIPSFNIFNKKPNYDSEESSSSLPNTMKEKTSILDKLLEKCGGRKKRKYNRKDDHSPKVVPKSENNLLPTPGFEASEKESPVKDKKIKGPIVSEKSALLNFRKDTINNFKDAFINSNNTVIHNKLTTVVLTSRTRKETKALQQRATIKEVFGAERPASAPPCDVTAMNNVKIKKEVLDDTEFSVNLKELAIQKEAEIIREIKAEKDGDDLKDKGIKQEMLDDSDEERKLIEFVIKRDPDAKFETASLDSEEGITNKRRNRFGKLRRKFSSGFDYIRKKKKIKKDINAETPDPSCIEKKKRLSSKILESVDDIQKEIKTWVLNKGIGESHLHRAARLGYNDITAYCLEKMDCHPSPKDNAGYTPLHEACSRGHLQIAKLLLMYGANVHESAQGGIRPLHMAVENGYVEIVRLLLSYGADPSLGTYAGMTPINLASDEDMKDLLLHHLADKEDDKGPPWHFRGPASCFDELEDLGYNIFDNPPKMDSEQELDDIEFEVSESMLPNLYTIRGEPPADRWVLLQDLSAYLKVKSRDTLLRQITPVDQQGGATTAKNLIRELKMAEFLEQARCCQFLNQGEKINTRSNKIALVKYTDKVKELLGIELVTVGR